MPERLFGYIRSSRALMARQLEALEQGQIKLMKCDESPEIDLSPMVIDALRKEIETVDELIQIYGVQGET